MKRIIILLTLVTAIAGCMAYDPLSPAEHAVLDKYDSVFSGALLSFKPDEWADGKVYKRQYRHGIYRVTFLSLADRLDFRKIAEDSLKAVADNIRRDLHPAIPNIDLYDSIHIRYQTRYRTKQPGEWPSSDTSFHMVMQTIGYGLR